MEKLIKQIKQWAEDRGILSKATPTKQALKTLEECTELLTAIADDDGTEIKDAIGDIVDYANYSVRNAESGLYRLRTKCLRCNKQKDRQND